MLKHALAKLSVLPLALGLALACSEEDDHEEEHETPAACAPIGEVCTHDVHTTLGAECHDIYHDGDAALCSDRQAECVAHCEAELAAGGAGGGGGAGGSH